MDLKQIQQELNVRYGHVDKTSGSIFLLSVLLEECGELASAVRRNRENVGDEVADVIFCALSIANLLDIDAESLIVNKYIKREFTDVVKTWNDIPK